MGIKELKQYLLITKEVWIVLEAISKTRASCLTGVSRHLETIKALGLRPRAFICFSVSGNPGQTLALVFDLLLPISLLKRNVIPLFIHGESSVKLKVKN